LRWLQAGTNSKDPILSIFPANVKKYLLKIFNPAINYDISQYNDFAMALFQYYQNMKPSFLEKVLVQLQLPLTLVEALEIHHTIHSKL